MDEGTQDSTEVGFERERYRGGTPKGYTKTKTFERRRAVAALLAKRGAMTGREVADELGITESTASRDIAAIKAIWRAEMIEDVDLIIARDLAELGVVKAAAWEAYQDSCETGDVTVTEAEVLDKDGSVRDLKTVVARNPKASLAALKVVQSCIEQKRKILGLDKDVSSLGAGKAIVFTVKIGDRVLVSEASTGDASDVDDAEFIELDSTGKALPSGDGAE